MVEIPQDADVNQLSKGDARHSGDEDQQMDNESTVPAIGDEATA